MNPLINYCKSSIKYMGKRFISFQKAGANYFYYLLMNK